MATITIAAIANAAEAGLQDGQFLLTLSEALTSELTVFYRVTGTATRNNDYSLNDDLGQNLLTDFLTGTVTIAAGETTARITVNPVDDFDIESPETVTVTLLDGDDYDLGATQTQATVTIASDDTNVSLAVSPGSVDEDGTTNLVYTFTREGVISDPLTVGFNVGGTADFADGDYTQTGADAGFTGAAGTVTFAPGSPTATVTINPTPNTEAEDDKTIALSIVPNANYQSANFESIDQSFDDIVIPTVGQANLYPSTIDVAGLQGNIDRLTVTLNNITHTFPDDIDVLLVGPTGASVLLMSDVGGNVDLNNVTLTFDATAADPLPDAAQIFGGTFQPTNVGGGDIFLNAPGAPYGANLDVFHNTDPNGTWSLYVVDDAGGDFGIIGGWSLEIFSGEVGTIVNNDTLVTLTNVNNATENGNDNLVYTFERVGVTDTPLTVNFTVGGTATLADSDYQAIGAATYTATTGSVTFASGSNTATVTIDPTPDSTVENDETVALTLATGTGYTVGTVGPVTGTIENDDTSVTVAVAPASVAEDGADTLDLVYTFTRAGVLDNALTVNFTVGGTADSIPGNGIIDDYTQPGALNFNGQRGSVNFTAGSATATVTIDPNTEVNPNATDFADETVILTVASGNGYTIGATPSATGTITNDDTQISLSVSPGSVVENGTDPLVYTFTRVGVTNAVLVANFTRGGDAVFLDANAADPFRNDYIAIGATTFTQAGGTVTFAAADDTTTPLINESTTVQVRIFPSDTTVNNLALEDDKTVALTLTPNAAYTIDPDTVDPVERLIIDNEAPRVTLTVAPGSVDENGTQTLVYTFNRTGSGALTVNFAYAGTATLTNDYTQAGAATFANGVGTVSFAASDTTKTVTITPVNNDIPEQDETLVLTLTPNAAYTIPDSQEAVTGTIRDDDAPRVSLSVSSNVQEDGNGTLVYTFTRSGDIVQLAQPLTVSFDVDGDADFGVALGDDYTQVGAATFTDTTGTVTFAANAATATVTIVPTDDTTVEDDETVALTLNLFQSGGFNPIYTIGTEDEVEGTIVNDDAEVSLAVSPGSVAEDGTNLVYTFTRVGALTNALTVSFDVAGTATFGGASADYTQTGAENFTATTGTVIFAAGAATATVTIDPIADTDVEAPETVSLTLTGGGQGTGYTIVNDQAVQGTIANDDTNVTLAINRGSVDEDGIDNLVYTFTRAGELDTPRTVEFDVTGTATFGSDYQASGAATFTATAGTVTFASGSNTATVTIDPTPDGTAVNDGDETVKLTLKPVTGSYTIGTTEVEGTINNDDAIVTLAATPASVLENGQTNLVYTFTRSGSTNGPLTVNFNVGGTATLANNDYQAIGAATFDAQVGTVTFASGSSTATVTIDPRPDTTSEGNETVALTLTGGADYTVGTTTAVTGTITNDDTLVTLAILPGNVNEDNSQNLVYTFTRTGILTDPLTVNFTVDGDATFGGATADYNQTGAATFTATTGTVTFAAGSATATVTIDPRLDTTVEPDEFIDLALTTGTGYTVGTVGAVTGRINNDDTRITLALNQSSVDEDGGQNLGYTFTRTGLLTNFLTVNFNIGGDAISGTDYQANQAETFTGATGTVLFAPGQGQVTVNIDPTGDTTVEEDETVALTLAEGSGDNAYTIGTTGALTGTILNDDNPPGTITLAVSPASVLENGTTNLVYTFTRSGTPDTPLTVNFTRVGGTATFGNDYTQTGANAAFNQVTFASNSSTATVTIDPTGDTTIEADETVALTLAAGAGYTVGTTRAVTATIQDDDAPRVSLAVSSPVAEDGTNNLLFTFTRPAQAATSVLTVNYSIGGTAILNNDYTVTGTPNFDGVNGTVTFGAGATEAIVTIDPTVDTAIEEDETVSLILTQPVLDPANTANYYNVGTVGAVEGTILNDDTIVTLAVSPASVNEDGESNLEFTFTRTGGTTNALTVNYTVAGSATADTDYTGATNTVTFEAGEATATVTIDPTVDGTIEPNETVALTLATGTGYTIGTSNAVTGTIADDDLASISLTVSPDVDEDGEATLEYTFVRVGSTANALTINYTVAGTADLDTDYTVDGAASFTATTGTVTFEVGSATATVTIDPTADTTVEDDETVILTLAEDAGYIRNTTTAVTGTIANDDTIVTLAVSPVSVLEDQTTNLVYTFTREGVEDEALTVNFTVGGTANLATDYLPIGAANFAPTTGTVTFASGETTATVTIDPTVDTTGENDETVVLTLATGDGYLVGTEAAVTGTILNDDVALPSISLAVSPDSVEEDGEGNLVYTFTRTLTAEALEVNFTVGGDAIFGGSTADYTVIGADDFNGVTGSLTFATGSATATVRIDPTSDTTVEDDETVTLTLAAGTDYTIDTTAAVTGTIADDDAVAIPTATIAATDNAASEQGDNPGEFTITLSAAPTADVVLTYTVAGTAATNGSDYTALDGTVTVLAGETTATIAVLPVEDAIVEGNESVIVTLTDGAAYDLGAATVATVTIADSVITDIDGNTDINDADIALVVDFLLGATPGELESTFNQYSSLTEGASNTTAEELAASIESQLSLFDIDGSGETTTADIFVINSYILFQDLFGGSRPAIESQLASLAEDLSLELTGPNTTGPGLYNTLSALFV